MSKITLFDTLPYELFPIILKFGHFTPLVLTRLSKVINYNIFKLQCFNMFPKLIKYNNITIDWEKVFYEILIINADKDSTLMELILWRCKHPGIDVQSYVMTLLELYFQMPDLERDEENLLILCEKSMNNPHMIIYIIMQQLSPNIVRKLSELLIYQSNEKLCNLFFEHYPPNKSLLDDIRTNNMPLISETYNFMYENKIIRDAYTSIGIDILEDTTIRKIYSFDIVVKSEKILLYVDNWYLSLSQEFIINDSLVMLYKIQSYKDINNIKQIEILDLTEDDIIMGIERGYHRNKF